MSVTSAWVIHTSSRKLFTGTDNRLSAPLLCRNPNAYVPCEPGSHDSRRILSGDTGRITGVAASGAAARGNGSAGPVRGGSGPSPVGGSGVVVVTVTRALPLVTLPPAFDTTTE